MKLCSQRFVEKPYEPYRGCVYPPSFEAQLCWKLFISYPCWISLLPYYGFQVF